MKVVYASTPDQEQKIKELVRNFYSNIFPLYFPDVKIKEFEQLRVLHISERNFKLFSTLKEAYQVIVSLETISAILEADIFEDRYESIFNKNVGILQNLGLFFPFEMSCFHGDKIVRNEIISMYTKAANEILV
ncbi:YhcU family protein [Bacillus sp. Bva_UNVM-123]|uniref:DUF5365 family protein n=1 Tax=Bacillus sp. Bva_UNVM-123 TaxID=2829798 RepID=UPI00391F1E89